LLPIKDENPTSRPAIVTFLIIAACIGIYFFWQPTPFSDTPDDLVFTYEHAAVPCEVLHGRPLTQAEVRATYPTSTSGLPPSGDACGVGTPGSPPVFPHKNVWLSVVVSMFLHGSILHLGGNMLFLWIFGNNIEDRIGRVRYLLFYLAGGLVAAAAHILLNANSTIPVVGASGAIAAVMGAYLVWFPNAPVRTLLLFLFIIVVRIRAKWLLGFWFLMQFATNPNSGVAWVAHVAGFVFGVLFALMVRNSPGAQRATLRESARPVGAWDSTGGAGTQWYDDQRRFGSRR
jgi:membrane associated rhomboid family serine protease